MKKINNIVLGTTLPLVAASPCALTAKTTTATKRPNVILIYVDDLGYGDLSCYGSTLVRTPNIDFLAANGVRFTQNYVMAPVSAPSRVGLMSGAYPTRLGMDANNGKCFTLDTGHRLLPQAFKQAGYTTAISGKWNVPVAIDHDFDFSRYRINFAASYWPEENGVYNGVDNKNVPTHRNGLWKEATEDCRYLTDMVFDAAVEFVDRQQNSDKPFFLYVAPNAPHYPLQAKLNDLERVREIENPAYRTYAAMIMALDDDIGRLLDALRRRGMLDDTIVCFSSDNGPSMASGRKNDDMGAAGASTWYWPEDWPTGLMFHSTNGMKGSKGSLHEGGIRLPLIMYYPKLLKPGMVCDQVVANMDIYPTFCAMTGVPVPCETQLDGIDITPLLRGESSSTPHDCLYWKMRDQGAVRRGDWKLFFNKKGMELYNIAEDVNEKRNLALEKPELTAELRKLWEVWYAQHEPVFFKTKPGAVL